MYRFFLFTNNNFLENLHHIPIIGCLNPHPPEVSSFVSLPHPRPVDEPANQGIEPVAAGFNTPKAEAKQE